MLMFRTLSQEIENRIYSLLLHLRDYHYYCYYCVTQFSSYSDLTQACVHITESDHEDS